MPEFPSPLLAPLILGVATLGATVAAAVLTFPPLTRAKRSSTTAAELTLEQRVARLVQNMRESGRLVEQVTAELELRAATAEKLQAQADAAEQIVKLTAEQQKAVARLVRTEVAGESKRAFRQSLLANALLFLAGVLATITVTLFVHPAYGPDTSEPGPSASPVPTSTR